MRLRPGAKFQTVIDGLRPLKQNAWNYTSDDESYVLFISGLEDRFREWFTDVPPTLLYSDRFWQISSGTLARPHEMRRQECARVIGLLDSLMSELEAIASRLGPLPRRLGVLDTNVLLHYKPLHETPWGDVFGDTPVTLVIPRRVLAELDGKKAVPNNPKLRTRAQTRIRLLEQLLLRDDAGAIYPVVDNVAVAVVGSVELDPVARRGTPPPPDVEILDVCEALGAYAPEAVSIVTGDIAMKVFARDAGVAVTSLPDDCYQPLGEAG